MKLFSEIGALFKLRTIGTNVLQEATAMNGVKPGWKTSEFWIKIFTVDLPLLWGVVHSFIPATTAAEIELGALTIYNVGRMVVKAVNDIKSIRTGQPVAATATGQPIA